MSELVYLYMHEYKADVYIKKDIMLDTEYWYVCIKPAKEICLGV